MWSRKVRCFPLLYKGVLCTKFTKEFNRIFEIVVCVHNESIISFRTIQTMVFIYLKMIIAYIFSDFFVIWYKNDDIETR